MKQMKILSPTAILGYGFPESSFKAGMAAGPDVIAVDAGSTDPGPYYLGAGKPFVDRANVYRDLDYIIPAGIKTGIPVVIGTGGGSGARPHVEWCLDIITEIAREHGIHPNVGIIYADVSKDAVRNALNAGMVTPLTFVPELDADTLDATEGIVAQMGMAAIDPVLDAGVDIVLCGRCYDPAVFAAVPVRAGFDAGLAIHMGKILECAAIAAAPGSGRDCVLGIIEKERFVLQPLSKEREFTTASVAAHTLYEKSDPRRLPGPDGVLDLTETEFTQLPDGCVAVSGSRFVPADPYTVKLEGVVCRGYRTVSVCGTRDPIMISQLDDILAEITRVAAEQYPGDGVSLLFRQYGKNAVMGAREPLTDAEPHEVGIVIEAIAPTQDRANALCGYARSTMLHYGYPGRISTAGNLAFPFSPSDFPGGKVYEFSLNHIIPVADPAAFFPFELKQL